MIKKITIKHFKSIYDQTIDLSPVTVLVGRSGTGKSNIVHALRFLRNYILSEGNAIDYEGGWARIFPSTIADPKLELYIDFFVQSVQDYYSYYITFSWSRNDQQSGRPPHEYEEKLSIRDQDLFHRIYDPESNRWSWVTVPSLMTPPKPDQHLAIKHLPALEEVVYAYTALSSGIGFYSLPNTVLSIFDNAKSRGNLFYDQLPGLHDDGKNYLDAIKNISQDLHKPHIRKSIISALKQLNSSIASIEIDSITQPTKAIVSHKLGENIVHFNLDQESDGFRRFYVHLLALYQNPSKLVNIFEEPENAIFPGALSLLAEEFKAAPDSNRGQVILTTHSPGLLDHFDVDQIRVVEMENGQTVVGPVSKEQREAVRDSLLTTGELLTVDQARLDKSETASGTHAE